MPLFRRKKKVKEDSKIPSFESLSKKDGLNELPKIKFSGENDLEFPEYEKDLGGIKKAVSGEKGHYDPTFALREKKFDGGPKLGGLDIPEIVKPRKMAERIRSFKPSPRKVVKPVALRKPVHLEKPIRLEESLMKKEDIIKERGFGEKPIFVKIDQYKKMISTIDGIQDKLDDAAKLVSEIKSIKLEEDHLLDAWHSSIERIKSDLVRIDKRVFE